MIKSRIQFTKNRPMIAVDSELCAPIAYTTYFHECGQWSDFIKSGYRMFFVNVSFTDLPINNATGFSPFRTGVFETETPDYAEFETTVRGILSKCPDALIFPRINIAMPRKWIEAHPTETVTTPMGERESLFSDSFMSDGAELLTKMLSHMRSSDYADRIVGYQLCGGNTQEWFPHDLFGSYSEMGMNKFKNWAFKKYGIEKIEAPERNDFESGKNTENVRLYYEFANEMIPRTIEHFVKVTKEFINHEQIVGVFYGYNDFVSDTLWCTHGLRHIIASPYIDFFSSPCCYDDRRNLGLDWGDMIPVDSIKHHGKLCFIECDIRTHLTKRMQESRPGEYPDDIMKLTFPDGSKTVWKGPDTPGDSLSAIQKAFAHQLAKGSGIWWFDMWGGWYDCSDIMNEMKKLRKIYDDSESDSASDVAFFIDEGAYGNIPRGNPLLRAVNNTRVAMGNTGIPFDTYMVEDAEKVLSKYRFAIFPAPIPTEAGKCAVELCKSLNIPCLVSDEEKPHYSTPELRDILVKSGIHCYNTDNNVIYRGNGILAIHAQKGGETRITLPKKCRIKPLTGTAIPEEATDTITLNIPKHSTLIFVISET